METPRHAATSKEIAALEEVTNRLRRRFPELGSAVIDRVVQERYAALADAPIRDFIPVLVEHIARDDLEHR